MILVHVILVIPGLLNGCNILEKGNANDGKPDTLRNWNRTQKTKIGWNLKFMDG